MKCQFWDSELQVYNTSTRCLACEQVESCHRLRISTCARKAAYPSSRLLSSTSIPRSVFCVRPKQRPDTMEVSHVFSLPPPFYEGLSRQLRLGGPYHGLEERLGIWIHLYFMTSRSVLKPRSCSRSKRPFRRRYRVAFEYECQFVPSSQLDSPGGISCVNTV
ncbi:hypothetical protein BJV74DRAFT_40793 [Russula compacta]|nr:hypothetical protein BJV74DRAFT_40793 [Russula compacta]